VEFQLSPKPYKQRLKLNLHATEVGGICFF
jgi:hypothetical protein